MAKRKSNPDQLTNTSDFFTVLLACELRLHAVKEYQFCPKRRWRFDYAIPEYKLAIEVEGGVWTGGRHVNPKGFLGDMEKYNTAAAMGWRLLRATPDTLNTYKTLKLIKTALFNPIPQSMNKDPFEPQERVYTKVTAKDGSLIDIIEGEANDVDFKQYIDEDTSPITIETHRETTQLLMRKIMELPPAKHKNEPEPAKR